MKKITLLLLFAVPLLLTGQVEKEAIYASGGLSFSSQDASLSVGSGGGSAGVSANLTDFNISAGGGYMFTDIFGAGLTLGFNSSKTAPAEGDSLSPTMSANTFLVAPNARTFIEIDEPLYFTGIFTVSMGFGKVKTEQEFGGQSFDSEASLNTFGVSLAPGLTYFFSDQIALDVTFGSIGYSSTSFGQSGDIGDIDTSSDGFQFLVDMSTLNLGLTVFFNN